MFYIVIVVIVNQHFNIFSILISNNNIKNRDHLIRSKLVSYEFSLIHINNLSETFFIFCMVL